MSGPGLLGNFCVNNLSCCPGKKQLKEGRFCLGSQPQGIVGVVGTSKQQDCMIAEAWLMVADHTASIARKQRKMNIGLLSPFYSV